MKISKGTVKTRSDSPYIWIHFSVDGKRYRRKTKYLKDDLDNFKIVEDELLPLLKAKIRSGEIILDKVSKNSFRHYSELLMKSKIHLKPTTIKLYNEQIAFWISKLGDKNVAEIKTSTIKNILFSKDVTPEVLKNLLNICRAVFNEAYLDEVIDENPCNRIRVQSSKKKDIQPFSKDEVQRILSNATGFFRNYLAIAFYTGIRTGELLALKWQNIDLAKRRIYIDSTIGDYEEQSTKTLGSARYVPIFDALVPYILDQEKISGLSERVFTTSSGRHYGSGNLTEHHWKPLLRRLKIPYRSKYETRHTFCTNMLESQQFNLNQIAKWLGHSTIQTLIRRYNKFIPSENINFESNFDVFSSKNDTKNDTQVFKGA